MTPPQAAEAPTLEAFSRRYRAALAVFFKRRIRPESDVDDLIQEVFVRLARRGNLASIENVEGYLFQVAANLVHERAQRMGRYERSEEGYFSQSPGLEDFSPERILMGEEEVRQVLAALHELPERTRHVFMLHRFEDLKHSEIAARLGIPVSTIEKDIMRAMAHLLKRTR